MSPAIPDLRCRCGFDRAHPMVEKEPKYSLLGWLVMMLGATPRPVQVAYRCTRCGRSLGTTRDPEILKNLV
jgi:hypothetical protein